jgi:hypothetical protein
MAARRFSVSSSAARFVPIAVTLEQPNDTCVVGRQIRGTAIRDHAHAILWKQLAPHELDQAVEAVDGFLQPPPTQLNDERPVGKGRRFEPRPTAEHRVLRTRVCLDRGVQLAREVRHGLLDAAVQDREITLAEVRYRIALRIEHSHVDRDQDNPAPNGAGDLLLRPSVHGHGQQRREKNGPH